MEESGIEFACGVDAATRAGETAGESAAVVLAIGAREARRVDVPGSDLDGIHFAVDYLSGVMEALLDGRDARITAEGKDVVVIGGGDTGVDCVACALRQGAASVRQVIRAKRPPATVDVATAWPGPRNAFAQGYGQREAADVLGEDPRVWSTDTIGFAGEDAVSAVRVCDISYEGARHNVEGTERAIPAQLVLIAKGFTGPEQPVLDAFGIDSAARADGMKPGSDRAAPIYLAGDARMGSTLVATAIADGLQAASRIAADLSCERVG